MAADYDLVILGGTLEGRMAALWGAHYGARIALVESSPSDTTPLATYYRHQALVQAGQVFNDLQSAQALTSIELSTPVSPFSSSGALAWVAKAATTLALTYSPERLRTQGVDVIWGEGQMQIAPLAVAVESRRLRSHRYLLAPGVITPSLALPGLDRIPYLTPETLGHLTALPQHLLIIGGSERGLELAQAFIRLGCRVTLALDRPLTLPGLDADILSWVRAGLWTDGIQVLESPTLELALTGNQIQVITDQPPFTVDQVLVSPQPHPHLPSLPPKTLGLTQGKQGLLTNVHLRTSHPRIYGCGPVLGGSLAPDVAAYEAEVALHNTLFWPNRVADYRTIPWSLHTYPAVARVGLTETQARHRYGEDVWILHGPEPNWIDPPSLKDPVFAWKVLVTPAGTILGCQAVGPQALSLVQTMAMAMEAGKGLHGLTPTAPAPLTAILEQWQRHRWQPGAWRRDWLENWLNWMRSRVRE